MATSPAWSRDGSQIAFISDEGLWIMDADGTKRVLLSADVTSPFDPVWSP